MLYCRDRICVHSVVFIVLVTLSFFSCKKTYEALYIRGSDSEVNLVQALAESYMDGHRAISIGVTGGGSGAGIAALINKKTDLANSSRPLTDEELHFAGNRNVKPFAIVFAQDAIAIIVNKNNPLQELTLEQLADIYKGKIKNWDEINGEGGKITVYGRLSSSGTYLFFRDQVLKGEYTDRMIGMNGTSQIVEALKNDVNGVGYVSSGYLSDNIQKEIKVLYIKKTETDSAYSPVNAIHLANDYYPIVRPLYQYSDGKPSGKLLDFILYELSAEGMGIIKQCGFQAVSGKYKIYNEQMLQQ